MPSDAQIGVVIAFFDAVWRLDRSAAGELITEDCEASLSAFVSGRRHYTGREGLNEWFDRVEANAAAGSKASIRRRRLLGDREDPDVICVVAQVSIARDLGGPLETESAYVLHMRDMLIASATGHLSSADGIAELADPYELG
jgi:ketosteroid isomerase-like protein